MPCIPTERKSGEGWHCSDSEKGNQDGPGRLRLLLQGCGGVHKIAWHAMAWHWQCLGSAVLELSLRRKIHIPTHVSEAQDEALSRARARPLRKLG